MKKRTNSKQTSQKTFQLKLTPRQREEIRQLSGKRAEALVLRVDELEERIAPGLNYNKGQGAT